MTTEHIECPTCLGKGSIFATNIRYTEGNTGPFCGQTECDRCKGRKTIPSQMLKWIEHGKELKARRRLHSRNILEESIRRGVTLTEWSRIERGVVDNLAIRIDDCAMLQTGE